MKIVRMVDFFERKFERKEENDFGMLFGITGFMLGGIRFNFDWNYFSIIFIWYKCQCGERADPPESSFTYRLYVETM